MSGGDAAKTLWIKAGKEVAVFFLRYIVPIGLLALLYFRDYQIQLFIGGGLYGLYLVYHLVSWPFS